MSEHSAKALARAKKIIFDLQQITEENGATEHEVLNAAKRLGEILEKYDLDMTDASVREDVSHCVKNEVFAADDYAGTLVTGIKQFCSIIAYTARKDEGHAGKYVFFGMEHDVAIALYLYEVCAEAMDHDWSSFMETNGYSMKKRQSFRAGFASRVYERLVQMKRERDGRVSSSRELMVLKDQLVTQEFAKKLGIKLVKSRAREFAADPEAYWAGNAAGSRVNLSNPLEGGSPTRTAIR